jgi:hypothetical protein
MTEAPSNVEEKKANPYNMNKEWHTQEDKPFVSADTLFFEQPQEATPSEKEATPQKESASDTNYKKRYDDLKKHYDNKVSQFKQREQELLAEAKIAAPGYKAPKSIDELEEFKKKHPDLYDTVESVAHLQSEQQIADIRQELISIKQREANIARKEAEAALRERHPDFEDIRGNENFHAWAKEQPQEIQNWIYKNSSNATLASRAIDLYKIENGIAQSSKKPSNPQGSAADMVSTKTKTIDTKQPKIWSEREIARMSVDQYDKYEKEINLAISEGRVVK